MGWREGIQNQSLHSVSRRVKSKKLCKLKFHFSLCHRWNSRVFCKRLLSPKLIDECSMCGSRTGQMNQFVPIIAVLGATGGRFDVYALSAARSWWFMQKVFSPVGAQNLQLVVCIRDHIAFFKHIHTSK